MTVGAKTAKYSWREKKMQSSHFFGEFSEFYISWPSHGWANYWFLSYFVYNSFLCRFEMQMDFMACICYYLVFVNVFLYLRNCSVTVTYLKKKVSVLSHLFFQICGLKLFICQYMYGYNIHQFFLFSSAQFFIYLHLAKLFLCSSWPPLIYTNLN